MDQKKIGAFLKRLRKEKGLTQEQLAQRMGKSRPAVANTLRLLALPDEVMAMLEEADNK